MKAIIDNKIYDTNKCELLFTYHRRILKKVYLLIIMFGMKQKF